MREIASRLIAKHGQAATLLRPSAGTIDNFGRYTPGPDTEYSITILIATYAVELQFISSGLLDVGDQRIFLSALGLSLTPGTDDRLRIGSEVFRTLRVSPLSPAGEVIFWEMQVRDD